MYLTFLDILIKLYNVILKGCQPCLHHKLFWEQFLISQLGLNRYLQISLFLKTIFIDKIVVWQEKFLSM